jgi:aconitate decarboxylase
MGSYGTATPTEVKGGVTAQLSQWISNLKPEDVPPAVLERTKYQLLDGVACALIGAHVPWSERYVEATSEYEPTGEYSVIGYKEVRVEKI